MIITRSVKAAYGAFLDRKAVTTMNRKSLKGIDLQYYNKLVETSGPSVHRPNRVVKSFIKAYKHQVAKLTELEKLNRPFKTTSSLVSDTKSLLKSVVSLFKKGK